MAKVIAVLLVSALLGMQGMATANEATAEAQQLAKADTEKAKKKKNKEKRECRRIRETGSRIATRVCKKPSQWAREKEESQESVRRSVDGARRATGSGES